MMHRCGRLRPALLIGLAVLLVLLGVGLLAARLYLSSARAAAQAAARLEEMFGAPVRVGAARIGLLGSTTLHDVAVYEPDATPSGEPVLRIAELAADVSALGILRSAAVGQVDLHGVQVVLHFDRQGRLTTRLPRPPEGKPLALPHVRLEDAELTLAQEGRPALVLHGVCGVLTGSAAGVELKGHISDPYWGEWHAGAVLTTRTGAVTLNLQTADARVDQARLEAVPYVPASVWQEVKASGHTSARVTIGLFLHKPGVHYRVELAPRDATVQVTAIDLQAQQASGQVVVEDNLVMLHQVRGRAAGGTLATDGELDFRHTATRMHFAITARDLVLRQLPARWKVPEQIEGKLSGWADLTLAVRDGKVQTRGSGKGQIADARVAGFPTSRPIELRLQADGERFRFSSPTPVLSGMLLALAPTLAAPRAAVSGADSPGTPDPLRLVTRVPHAISRAVEATARGTGLVLSGVGQLLGPLPPVHSKPRRPPNYIEANLALQDIDLARAVSRVGLKLPFRVAGRLSVQVQLGIPFDTPRDLRAYRARGKATLLRADIAGVQLDKVTARVDYADGVLDLQELTGEMPAPKKGNLPRPPGTFRGTARVQVVPQGELSADLKVDRIPLDGVLAQLPGTTGWAGGPLTGEVRFHAPVDRLRQPAAWTGTADLSAPQVRLHGLDLRDFALRLTADRGVATLERLAANVEGAPLTASGTVKLSGGYPFQGRLEAKEVDLGASARLVPDFRPPFPVAGTANLDARLRGTLEPMDLRASGSLRASDLVVAGIKASSVSFGWDGRPAGLELKDIRADLAAGTITGSAVLPLRPADRGRVDLDLKDVDVKVLAGALPALPVKLAGRLTARVTGAIASTRDGKSRVVTGNLQVKEGFLTVQGIPTQQLRGSVGYHAGMIEYHLQGEALGGMFKLDGKVPLRTPAAPPERSDSGSAARVRPVGLAAKPPDGHFTLEGARLSELWRVLGLRERLGQLRGLLSIDLSFWSEGPGGLPAGRGTVRLRRLRWEDVDLADSLAGGLVLSRGRLDLRDIGGDLAGGQLRLRAVYDFGRPRGSGFTVVLSGAEASRLLAVVGLTEAVEGALDVHLHGTLNAEVHGGGTLVLQRGRVAGVAVSEWRVPVRFVFVPGRGHGELYVSDSGAQLGSGRARLRATLTWGGSGLRVKGDLRLIDATLQSLAASLSSYAQGRVNGRVDFGGDSVRSLSDLTADVEARLQQTQAQQVPVLAQLLPFITPGRSNATFQTGSLRGRLAGGVLRIQTLTLLGTYLRLFANGTVALAGRLDLQVTAQTGQFGPEPLLLRLLRVRLPAFGPIPLSLIVEATSYLSNRVINMHVTGTVRHPVVQVEPLRLLTEEAVRFFINRAVSLP
jgi:hypothetical protein